MARNLFRRKSRHNRSTNREFGENQVMLKDDNEDYMIAKAMEENKSKNIISSYLNCTNIDSPIDSAVLFGQDDEGNYYAGVSVIPNNIDMIADFTVFDKDMKPICNKDDIGFIGLTVKEEGIVPLVDNLNACLSELNVNFNAVSRTTQTVCQGYWIK